jgi:hypothetical protein
MARLAGSFAVGPVRGGGAGPISGSGHLSGSLMHRCARFAGHDTAPVAQRIEHLTTDQKVRGSNPFGRALLVETTPQVRAPDRPHGPGLLRCPDDTDSGRDRSSGVHECPSAWPNRSAHPDERMPQTRPERGQAMLRSVLDQIDAAAVRAQYDKPLDYVQGLPEVQAHLDAARADVLAFTGFPEGVWRQVWSNNLNERLNREIRRRTESWASFPTAARSSRWSARSWASNATSGSTAAATSASTSCRAAASPSAPAAPPGASPAVGH